MKKITIISCILLSTMLGSTGMAQSCSGPSSTQCYSGTYYIDFKICVAPCDVCLPAFPLICVHTTCFTLTALPCATSDGYIPSCVGSGYNSGGTGCGTGTGNCSYIKSEQQCDGSDNVTTVTCSESTTVPTGCCGPGCG